MCVLHFDIQDAGKLHVQTPWLDRCGPKQRFIVKDLYVGDGSLQRYWSSDSVWLRLEIKQNHWSIQKTKVVFRTNLEQMFKRTATDLDTQPTTTQQRLTCALKMPGCCLMVAAASTIQAIRSSSESTFHSLLQQSLDWKGRANSLASQVTGSRTNGLFPIGSCWSPDLHASWL